MSKFLKGLFAVLAVAALSLCGMAPAYAVTSIIPNRVVTQYTPQFADATGVPLTFSTTSFANVTGVSITFNPVIDPNAPATAGFIATDILQIEWSADVSKVTATNGTCGVFVNGAQLAKSQRSANFAGAQETIGGVFYVLNTTTGQQTITLQCKSGDTNAFTVNNAELAVTQQY